MKFDAQGNRIAVRQVSSADNREVAYWFEQEKVNDYGFCDQSMACENVTHLCSRFKGHGGNCVAIHREEVAGHKIRRLERA